jgi:hypothetical protein
MQVSEAVGKKVALEAAVVDLCREFHVETGLQVKALNVSLTGVLARPADGHYAVNAEVML